MLSGARLEYMSRFFFFLMVCELSLNIPVVYALCLPTASVVG